MSDLGTKIVDGLKDLIKNIEGGDTPVLNAYILLDRSGSMSTRWNEALGSINAYVAGLTKGSATVTLATFDSVDGIEFDVIRDAVPSGEWKDVTDADATPRGGTPLFDAVGRIVALAETANRDKTIVVIMTDGGENMSREINKQGAKSATDRCKAKGWEVVFLGADFDASHDAFNVGVGGDKVMRMSAGNYRSAMSNLAEKSMAYSVSAAEVSFDDDDRKAAVAQS